MSEYKKYVEVTEKLKKFSYFPDSYIKYIATKMFDEKVRLSHPLMITWDLVNYCNLSCKFCSASASNFKCNSKLENYQEIIKFIKTSNAIYVTLRGGEPTIHLNFVEILNSFLDWNGFLEIVTNGSGINEDVVNALRKFNQDKLRVKVSLDSSDKIINDNHRSIGSFKYATNAIALLSKNNIKNIRVQAVASEKTIDGIFSLYKYLHKYNINSFGVSYCTPTGLAKNLKQQMTSSELIRQMDLCIKYYEQEGKIQLEKNHLGYWQSNCEDLDVTSALIANKKFRVKCGAGKWKLNIDADGSIYPCDFLKFSNFKIGNVTNNIKEIWNSHILLELYLVNRENKLECSKCNNKSCTTGCMGLAFEKFGSIYRRDPNCGYIDE